MRPRTQRLMTFEHYNLVGGLIITYTIVILAIVATFLGWI